MGEEGPGDIVSFLGAKDAGSRRLQNFGHSSPHLADRMPRPRRPKTNRRMLRALLARGVFFFLFSIFLLLPFMRRDFIGTLARIIGRKRVNL